MYWPVGFGKPRQRLVYATITAQGTFAAANANGSDNSPIPVLSLLSENTFRILRIPALACAYHQLGGHRRLNPGNAIRQWIGRRITGGLPRNLHRARASGPQCCDRSASNYGSDGYGQRDDFGKFLLDYPGLSHRKPGEPSSLLCLACPRHRRRRDKFDKHRDHFQSASPNGIPESDYDLGGVHHQWCDRRRSGGANSGDSGYHHCIYQRDADQLYRGRITTGSAGSPPTAARRISKTCSAPRTSIRPSSVSPIRPASTHQYLRY